MRRGPRRLGTIGAWAAHLRRRDSGRIADVAATPDQLGYGTL